MKEFDYYMFIDYSENFVGYLVIENNKISDLLPKISKFAHYKELKNKSSYIKSIKKIIEKENVLNYIFKIKKNQIVEVIVRTKKQLRKPFTFPDCQVAIRPYTQETYGKITAEDRATLRPTFEYDSNRKDAFFSRAFYRRFFPGGRSTLKPFPDVSGSE